MANTKKQNNPRRFRLKAKRRQNRRRQMKYNDKIQKLMNLGYPKSEAEKIIAISKQALIDFGSRRPLRPLIPVIKNLDSSIENARVVFEEAATTVSGIQDVLSGLPAGYNCQGGYRAAARLESAAPKPGPFRRFAQKIDNFLTWAASFRSGGSNCCG